MTNAQTKAFLHANLFPAISAFGRVKKILIFCARELAGITLTWMPPVSTRKEVGLMVNPRQYMDEPRTLYKFFARRACRFTVKFYIAPHLNYLFYGLFRAPVHIWFWGYAVWIKVCRGLNQLFLRNMFGDCLFISVCAGMRGTEDEGAHALTIKGSRNLIPPPKQEKREVERTSFFATKFLIISVFLWFNTPGQYTLRCCPHR
jgi:hypothetical protein